MTLVQVRDMAIILLALSGILLSLVFLVLSIMFYRKVGPLIDNIKVTMGNLQGTSTIMSEAVVKPVIKLASFGAGAKGALKFLFGLTKKKGG